MNLIFLYLGDFCSIISQPDKRSFFDYSDKLVVLYKVAKLAQPTAQPVYKAFNSAANAAQHCSLKGRTARALIIFSQNLSVNRLLIISPSFFLKRNKIY